MKAVVVRFMVGAHRALFTAATALLGVAGSLAADDPGQFAHWLLVAGAALLMYVEDECAEIHLASRALVGGSKDNVTEAQIDVFDTHDTKLLYVLVTLGMTCLLGGFILGAS